MGFNVIYFPPIHPIGKTNRRGKNGWIGVGIRIFRVDNPHTKPFNFWKWLIDGINNEYKDVVFLSEAFTKPSVMYELSKLGFHQSHFSGIGRVSLIIFSIGNESSLLSEMKILGIRGKLKFM